MMKKMKKMIIDCISDLHGEQPRLTGGDLLIIAGDLTTDDSIKAWMNFFPWLKRQDYKKKVIIGGNHDNFLTSCAVTEDIRNMKMEIHDNDFEYLCDSGCEYEGMKIWGSPWQLKFRGQNPHAMAFSVDDEDQLSEYWEKIPEGTDIVITHSPPFSILDTTEVYRKKFRVGSPTLLSRVKVIKPKLHVFGHIHGCGGSKFELDGTTYVNAAVMNDIYMPVHKPVRIEL